MSYFTLDHTSFAHLCISAFEDPLDFLQLLRNRIAFLSGCNHLCNEFVFEFRLELANDFFIDFTVQEVILRKAARVIQVLHLLNILVQIFCLYGVT